MCIYIYIGVLSLACFAVGLKRGMNIKPPIFRVPLDQAIYTRNEVTYLSELPEHRAQARVSGGSDGVLSK